MFRLNLKCRIITPMFMAGADGRTPELRPSEFKGMMRFWWRAIRAEDSIEKLREEEAKIFGGTGENQGRSKVWIRVKYQDPGSFFVKGSRDSTIQKEYNLNWYFDKVTKQFKGKHVGLGYLWYSTYLKNNERGFIKPPFEFEIHLVATDQHSFQVGSAVLWTAIYLGGFGTRARRGAGNLEVVDCKSVNINEIPTFKCQATDKTELKNFWEENLKKITKICKQSKGTLKYPTLKGAKIIILDPHNDWISALNYLGKFYQEFRIKHKNQIFETASFGMPVIHNRGSIRMVPYGKVRGKYKRLSERLGSSVIFKLIKSKGSYFPVIIKLSGKGVGYIGKEEKHGRSWYLKESKKFSEDLIFEFLSKFKNKEEILL